MYNHKILFKDVEAVFRGKNVTHLKGSKSAIKEIENHYKLTNKILKVYKENNTKLSSNLIRQFHYELMNGCYGEELLSKGERIGKFRKSDYGVTLYNLKLQLMGVEECLNSLIQEVNQLEFNERTALKNVSYFYCWFRHIHPFAYGNGRLGRLLINYLLIINNFPPVVIFENDKDEYYSALQYFESKYDCYKMNKFLEEQLYKTWIKNYNLKQKSLKDFLD